MQMVTGSRSYRFFWFAPYSSNRPGAKQPVLKIILVKNRKELNKFRPQKSCDDLCPLFCIQILLLWPVRMSKLCGLEIQPIRERTAILPGREGDDNLRPLVLARVEAGGHTVCLRHEQVPRATTTSVHHSLTCALGRVKGEPKHG